MIYPDKCVIMGLNVSNKIGKTSNDTLRNVYEVLNIAFKDKINNLIIS